MKRFRRHHHKHRYYRKDLCMAGERSASNRHVWALYNQPHYSPPLAVNCLPVVPHESASSIAFH
jgi:hypothetical protein